MTLTNNGNFACLLSGYPTISVRNGAGATLPYDYTDSGGMVVTNAPPTQINLEPGGSAYVILDKYRCDLGDKDQGTEVRVVIPGGDRALVATVGGAGIGFCGTNDPGNTINVSPFVADLEDGLNH